MPLQEPSMVLQGESGAGEAAKPSSQTHQTLTGLTVSCKKAFYPKLSCYSGP